MQQEINVLSTVSMEQRTGNTPSPSHQYALINELGSMVTFGGSCDVICTC